MGYGLADHSGGFLGRPYLTVRTRSAQDASGMKREIRVQLLCESALRSLFELVQEKIKDDAEESIGEAGENSMNPIPVLSHIHQEPSHGEINRRVDQIKTEYHQEAGACILNIELYAQRRRAIAHNGFRDSVEPDLIVAEHILREADESPCKQACDRTAPRHCEKNRDQQRKIQIHGETRKTQRDKGLQKEREQGNADGYRNTEPIDLNLLPGCVGDGHASVGCYRLAAAVCSAE